MLLSRQRNRGQNHNMNTMYRSYENVAQLKYLGRTITNKNVIREKIKNSGI
jgi:hypothetical protein